MSAEHYRTLGVHPDASHAEVRAAYLRVMRANHPDHRPSDPVGASTARQANAAWAVLGAPSRRAAYDRAHGHSPAVARHRVRCGAVGPGSAYSTDRVDYRRAFSSACLRVGTLIVALGTLLLLASV